MNRLAFAGEEEVDLVRNLTTNGLVPAATLAPVAVRPEFQNRGIGTQLINEALKVSLKAGESMVLVLGHKAYYPRFGFSADLARNIGIPFKVNDHGAFMALELKADALRNIRGEVRYPKAFGFARQWTIAISR